MRQPITISHKLHPARQQGKSLAGMAVVKYCLANNRQLIIGTADVDTLYNKIKFEFPEAKISKRNGYILLEKDE